MFERSLSVLPLAEPALGRLGKARPPGRIVGARGDRRFLRPDSRDPAGLARLVDTFRARTGRCPIWSCCHVAPALSATRAAYEEAVSAEGGGWPADSAPLLGLATLGRA